MTANYDNARSNSNLQETLLTPANVAPGSFGKLGTLAVDGQVFAQPLYVNSLAIPGRGIHDVLYIATEHNTVYAYDADTVASPILYWHVNLGPSVPSTMLGADYTDVYPEIGILGTPAIDPVAGVIYVVAETLQKGAPVFQLHALDLTSGTERMNGPVTIGGKFPGHGVGSDGLDISFDPVMHIQRPGLLFSKGTVYVAFGSHADSGVWHGWVMAYNAADLSKQTGVYNATPNGGGGSIWQSGRGLAADETGALYFITGNGDFADNGNMSESVVKLDGGTLKPADWYAPANEDWLSSNDYDLSAGVGLIPGTHLAIAGDKFGNLYLVNGDSMGHQDSRGASQFNISGGNFGVFTFALWSRTDRVYFYAQQQWGPVAAYRVSGNSIVTAPAVTSKTSAVTAFGGMAITANGGQPDSGILWQITRDAVDSARPGTLHAYNASTLAELWNSNMVSGDSLGRFAKFVSPTVANGKVYAATFSGTVVVYGLLPVVPTGSDFQPAISAVGNSASYASAFISPGEIVTIFGMSLGPLSPATVQIDSSGNVDTNLAATRVLFDGVPAPVLYASAGQVTAIAPSWLANPTTQLQVEYQGVQSTAFPISVQATAPGVFTQDSSGNGPAAALNQDYSPNSPANPAATGTAVLLYATGGGRANPVVSDGSVVSAAALPVPVLPVSVTIGGQPAQVLYAGGAPGLVNGLLQVNVQIPAGVAAGVVPITLTIGDQTAQQSVTINVK